MLPFNDVPTPTRNRMRDFLSESSVGFDDAMAVAFWFQMTNRVLMFCDAVGKLGITPLLKVICALRQPSYGITSDLADDVFEVSETTASICLQAFL